MEYHLSSLVLVRFLREASLLLSLIVRWFLFPCRSLWWPNSSTTAAAASTEGAEAGARHRAAAQAVRASLRVSTYGEMARGRAAAATCAVCLGEVGRGDRVRELGNCCHVFHQGCLDRWLDHDERLSCPLCRAMLVAGPSSSPPEARPSWTVERLLYLFGDDLHLAS